MAKKASNTTGNKADALDTAIKQIEQQFGTGSIMRLGQFGTKLNVDVIPTGCLSLDHALGVGGIPRGRVVEVFGPESSGKTTVALHMVAEAQKMGGTAVFIDAEHALDMVYAEKLGVDVNNLLISQPDTGEQALEIAEAMVRSGAIDIIVLDSVAALVPRAELEGDMGDAHVGLQARLMSQALRKLSGVINKSRTAMVFINQIREKIGVIFGNPEVTPGGRALKFYSSIRLDVRRGEQIKRDGMPVGNRTKVKVIKNKVAPPFRMATFDLIYGEGVSRIGDIIDLGVETGVVEKSGAWYSYQGERLSQGREKAKVHLQENPELALEIEVLVREALGLSPVAVTETEVETPDDSSPKKTT